MDPTFPCFSVGNKLFPSPYAGILFLSHRGRTAPGVRPNLSVPLFGDSFFMDMDTLRQAKNELVFPSPYSGILFLCLH